MTSLNGDTGLASLGQMVLPLLALHGLDTDAIAREAGVDPNRIPGPTERIELDRADAVFRRAADLIANPAFGLNAARCWHRADLGVLGHAWLSSSALRTGLRRLERYWHIVGERATTRIEDTRQGVKVAYRRKPGDPIVTSVVTDIAMAVMLDMCRMNAGAALRPVAVSLRRREPPQADAYKSFYGCPVRFGAEDDAFVLATRDMDRLLPSSNQQLAAVFDRMLTA